MQLLKVPKAVGFQATSTEQKTTIEKKRGKQTMNYTLHTWEIEHTENGPVATNKAKFETTDHSAIMARIKAIVGTGIQYVVNRQAVSKATV